jgi:hypothetical protein
VIVEREGHGVVMVTTMRWPRNERWVAVKPEPFRISITSGVWTRDVWFASQLGGRGYLPWGFADPWNRPMTTTAWPMQVPLTFTSVDLWKLAALFGVLPLMWIVRRIFRPKRRFSGFEVGRIGSAATSQGTSPFNSGGDRLTREPPHERR